MTGPLPALTLRTLGNATLHGNMLTGGCRPLRLLWVVHAALVAHGSPGACRHQFTSARCTLMVICAPPPHPTPHPHPHPPTHPHHPPPTHRLHPNILGNRPVWSLHLHSPPGTLVLWLPAYRLQGCEMCKFCHAPLRPPCFCCCTLRLCTARPVCLPSSHPGKPLFPAQQAEKQGGGLCGDVPSAPKLTLYAPPGAWYPVVNTLGSCLSSCNNPVTSEQRTSGSAGELGGAGGCQGCRGAAWGCCVCVCLQMRSCCLRGCPPPPLHHPLPCRPHQHQHLPGSPGQQRDCVGHRRDQRLGGAGGER
mgnify:CR=1 FL=1